jgi:DNA-binding MarR family transcriptional regulator
MAHLTLTNQQSLILEALYQRHTGCGDSILRNRLEGDRTVDATASYRRLCEMGLCQTVRSEAGVRRCHLTDAGLEVCRQTFPRHGKS